MVQPVPDYLDYSDYNGPDFIAPDYYNEYGPRTVQSMIDGGKPSQFVPANPTTTVFRRPVQSQIPVQSTSPQDLALLQQFQSNFQTDFDNSPVQPPAFTLPPSEAFAAPFTPSLVADPNLYVFRPLPPTPPPDSSFDDELLKDADVSVGREPPAFPDRSPSNTPQGRKLLSCSQSQEFGQ